MKPWTIHVAVLLSLAVSTAAFGQTGDQAAGKKIFDLWCSGCHKPLGPYVPSVAGTSALVKKYQGTQTPAALEERTDLTPAIVKFYVRKGFKSMPFFRKTEVSDTELASLIAYLTRNSK
jgi:(+)-pinoresinol hydroxylase